LDKALIASARVYPKTGKTQDDVIVDLTINAKTATSASIGQPGEEDLHFLVRCQVDSQLVLGACCVFFHCHNLDKAEPVHSDLLVLFLRGADPQHWMVDLHYAQRHSSDSNASLLE
jgi:hypothetical protein